jgi:magnesium chelatase subunit D
VTDGLASGGSGWADAALAAALFAVDPAGLSGVAVRAHAGPVRDRWLALLRELLPMAAPVRRLPLHVADGRLLGGLDLAATLRAGRPVADRGLLAESDCGIVLVAMAERLTPGTAARLAATLDTGEVLLERDGLALRTQARFGVVALDEGSGEDERPPAALLDRLALQVNLAHIGIGDMAEPAHRPESVAVARLRLADVEAGAEILEALCAAAMALAVDSIRAPLLAIRVARAAAALAGRSEVGAADAAVAGRLVLAPRARARPAAEPPTPEADDPSPPETNPGEAPPPGGSDDAQEPPTQTDLPLEDLVLAAAQAAMPANLLAQLQLAGRGPNSARSAGRAGASQLSAARGRPTGVRRGEPRAGARLSVVETLRAAAPWQPLRRRETGDQTGRIQVRRDDFRVTRFRQRTRTTTIFVVDASGSLALNRLAEAKGAVELLLADCYVRRDRVALLAFRGRQAELVLPPTRSLVRAKRSLAGLPGGGGTPLATGIDAAAALADAIRRKDETPILVLLTDGRANVSRDGMAGRPQAEQEALAAARLVRAAGFTTLLVDTSTRPQLLARQLAEEMQARYLPLPFANSALLSQAVRALAPHAGGGTS